MDFNLNIISIIVISVFVFGIIIFANYYLYSSPRRSGLKWAIWLGGMFLGIGFFDMVLIVQLIQMEPQPIIWIILTPPLTSLLTFLINLFTQWLKYRDYKARLEADTARIEVITHGL